MSTDPFDWRRPAPARPYAEVIGDPIAQSKSPAIHNFWLEKLGIDAEYRACHVRAEELADYFTQRRRDAEWRGCNVTMPHKQAVMASLNKIDPSALLIGAVNTVAKEPMEVLRGYNTDIDGFLEPLLPLIAGRGIDSISIVGTGGAARAVISGLTEVFADRRAKITLVGRDRDRALTLLRELVHLAADAADDHVATIEDLQHLLAAGFSKPYDDHAIQLIVNASALGMVGNPPLELDLSLLPEGSVVYDIVTAPIETPLLKAARARGLDTIDGLAMLIGQAAAAFEKFFGQPAPREHDVGLRALLTR